MTDYSLRRFRDDDYDAVHEMIAEAFRFSIDREAWLKSGHVLQNGSDLYGAAATRQLGQFFGRQSISSTIIDALNVNPRARGRGIGSALMGKLLAQLHASGVALASGSPSTHGLYRRLGFEICGVRNVYRASLDAVPRGLRSLDARVEPWDDGDLPGVAACYQRFATENNGLLDRDEHWWRERVLHDGPSGAAPYRFLVRRDGVVKGYVVYEQVPEPAAMPYFSIVCRELVWTDAESQMALLDYLSSQRALGRHVDLPGGSDEPLLLAFEQQALTVRFSVAWLARIVNLRSALLQRGYPSGADVVVDLAVHDDVILENNESIRIEVRDGQVEIASRSKATVELDISTLTGIFTGWLDPLAARRLGRIRGATWRDLDALSVIFGGARPWIMDVL